MQIFDEYKTNHLKYLSTVFLFSLILLTPLPNLGTDIYTPSLPAIVISLTTNNTLVKLSVTTYLITYGIGQLFFGFLSDLIGRRFLLLTGLLFFNIFTLLGGGAKTIHVLLIARFFQGLFASSVSVLTKSIIADKYRGSRLKKVSHYKVTAQIFSIIFAPLLGGYIQLTSTWRFTFVFLALYGSMCFILAFYFIPETLKKTRQLSFQMASASLLKICGHLCFMLMTINTAILYAMVGLFGILGSFIIQQTFHYTPVIYGLSALACGLAYVFSSSLSHKISSGYLVIFYLTLVLTSSLILILVGKLHIHSLSSVLIPIMFIMSACGLLLPRIMGYTLTLFRNEAGTSSAIFGALVMLGMGMILSLAGFFHTSDTIPLGVFYLLLGITSTFLLLFKAQYNCL